MGEMTRAIRLPEPLYKAIEERIRGTEFASVEDYVTFVLEEVLREDESELESLSPEDEEEVKKRLKSLGYLD